jgi:SHS2 domain-containing protein
MKKFEYDDSIAGGDCAYRAYGATLEELFINAALAATQCMVDLGSIDNNTEREIHLSADSETDLLYEWLEEIVFLKDAEELFLKEFDIKFLNSNRELRARALGEKINPEKHRIFVDVKAVTMYRFNLEKTEQGWEAFIVLDL